MFATVVLLLVTLLLLVVSVVIGNKTSKYPPGPFSWPFIGSQFLLKRLSRELGGQHIAFLELSKRYGSEVITVDIGTDKVLVISGNKLIQNVMKNEEYDGRPWNEFIKLRNMGKKQGITMNDGSEWKELRGWMVRTMRIFGFGKREMSEMIKNELIVLQEDLKKGGVRKLKPLITPAVVNVLWNVATGKPFCEDDKLQYFSSLMERRAQVFDMLGGLLTTFPWIRYVAPGASGYNLLLTLNHELKTFLLDTIAEHRKNYKPGCEADVIDMFLHEMINNEDTSGIFTEEQLVILLLDLFIAGSTTTGITLDFLFLHMVVHQKVQQRLQQEIDSVIPRDRLPDLADRTKLPYVEAIISETQRLCPVFPILGPRRVLRETNLDKYRIPKNATILMNTYSISSDPDIYPEPDKFKPERFIKDGVFEPDANSLNFGKGKRRCPGEALAKAAMFILFVGVMQKFTLLPVPDKGPNTVEIVPGLTISPKPYEVLVVPR
ncbi:Probable cytochrome P450 305a1 [Anthophora plagiata]